MSAVRTQIYLSEEQRRALDQRARAEHTTMAHVVRDAIDRYLAGDLSEDEREHMLLDTFGALPGFGNTVPDRDEWGR